MKSGVKHELINGFIMNFIAKYSNVIIQFIIGAVLARLLSPKEFGIVAIVMVFVAFFNLLAYMGIGPALIQHKDLSKLETDHIFVATIFFGALIAILFYASSGFVAYFFGDDVYINIVQILSVSIFFFSLAIIPKSIATKNKQFKRIGIIDVTINTIIGLITLWMANSGFSYYAIIYKSVFTSIFSFLIYFFFSGISLRGIRLDVVVSSTKKVLSFSVFQSLFDIINYFSRNMDNLMIGKFLGDIKLGYYDIAYKLMLYPITNFTHVLTPVLLPVLKDYQDDRELIYKYYKDIVKVLSIFGVIAAVMLFFCAEELIVLIYGVKWLPSVGVFRILAVTIGFQMVVSSSGSIFQVLGKTKALFISGSIGAILMTTAFSIGILSGGIEGVAIGFLIGSTINFFIAYYILINRVMGYSLINFLKGFQPSIKIGIIMVALLLITYFFTVNSPIVFFGIKCCLGGLGALIGLIVTGIYKDMGSLIFRKDR